MAKYNWIINVLRVINSYWDCSAFASHFVRKIVSLKTRQKLKAGRSAAKESHGGHIINNAPAAAKPRNMLDIVYNKLCRTLRGNWNIPRFILAFLRTLSQRLFRQRRISFENVSPVRLSLVERSLLRMPGKQRAAEAGIFSLRAESL